MSQITARPLYSELQPLLETPIDEIPDLLGDLETLRVKLTLRLNSPAPELSHDQLLTVEQAAERLNLATGYLYRHHGEFPFARKIGRKLLFSSAGLDQYISKKRR